MHPHITSAQCSSWQSGPEILRFEFLIKLKEPVKKKQTGNFLKRQEKHNGSKAADCFFYV